MNLDPAMKEMNQLSKACKIKDLDWGAVTITGVEDKMNQGVNKNHEYAPLSTAFPADLIKGLIPFPPYASWSFFQALYKFSNFMIKDRVPAAPRGSENLPGGSSAAASRARLSAKVADRYGTFLGPLGLLGLGMPYMPGEEKAIESRGCDFGSAAAAEGASTFPCGESNDIPSTEEPTE